MVIVIPPPLQASVSIRWGLSVDQREQRFELFQLHCPRHHCHHCRWYHCHRHHCCQHHCRWLNCCWHHCRRHPLPHHHPHPPHPGWGAQHSCVRERDPILYNHWAWTSQGPLQVNVQDCFKLCKNFKLMSKLWFGGALKVLKLTAPQAKHHKLSLLQSFYISKKNHNLLSNCRHFHSPWSISSVFILSTSTFINVHPLHIHFRLFHPHLLNFINFYPFSSTIIHNRPFSSTRHPSWELKVEK